MFMSCLSGWNPISRGDLHQMVKEAIANEPKERQRLHEAQAEFRKRTDGVTNTKLRVRIMKEVAEKYHYNEDYFIDKIDL